MRVRTDLYCHDCSHSFIAAIDYSIDGNHVVECPYCGHKHCRVIQGGEVTGDRWDARNETVRIERREVVKCSNGITTHSQSHFLLERWLNRE